MNIRYDIYISDFDDPYAVCDCRWRARDVVNPHPEGTVQTGIRFFMGLREAQQEIINRTTFFEKYCSEMKKLCSDNNITAESTVDDVINALNQIGSVEVFSTLYGTVYTDMLKGINIPFPARGHMFSLQQVNILGQANPYSEMAGGRPVFESVLYKADVEGELTKSKVSTSSDRTTWSMCGGGVEYNVDSSWGGDSVAGNVHTQSHGECAVRILTKDYSKGPKPFRYFCNGDSTNAGHGLSFIAEKGAEFTATFTTSGWTIDRAGTRSEMTPKVYSYTEKSTIGTIQRSFTYGGKTYNIWTFGGSVGAIGVGDGHINKNAAWYAPPSLQNASTPAASTNTFYGDMQKAGAVDLGSFDQGIGGLGQIGVWTPEEIMEKIWNAPVDTSDPYSGDWCLWIAPPYDLQTPEILPSSLAVNLTGGADEIYVHNGADGDKPSDDPNDYYPTIDPGDDTGTGDDVTDTGLGILTTTYTMNKTVLNQIGQFIWSEGYNPKANNASPLENVLAVKRFPMVIDGGGLEEVVIGGVGTSVNGYKHASTVKKYKIGALMVAPVFNNFFDYEPFTTAEIFIPFCGFKPISMAFLLQYRVTLQYIVDIMNGTCRVNIIGMARDETSQQEYVYDVMEGVIAIDIPVTATNFQNKEAVYRQISANMATTVIDSLALPTIGNVVRATKSITNEAIQDSVDLNNNKTHYTTKGNLDSATALGGVMTPYVVLEYPKYYIPAKYGQQVGFLLNQSKYLYELSGYTVVNEAELDGVACTDEERKMIQTLLQQGVYL